MQLLDRTLSRRSLQRWVAIITGTGAMLVGVVNFAGYILAYNLPVLEALFGVFALPIMILAGLFYLSGAYDSNVLRILQIAVFAIAGVFLALFASGEYMSSAVFIIFSFVLFYEYRSRTIARWWFIALGTAYGLAIFYSILRSVESATQNRSLASVVVGLAFTNIAIFTGSVVFLFALVLYRQHLIRKRHAEELEDRVRERTIELQEALEQRDTMLQEIHHRVGNSLQLLASFVSLQQDGTESVQNRILKETELRVHAIADVHATLYNRHQLSHLPLAEYAAELISDMELAYQGDARVESDLRTGQEAHIDFALTFGIVLNELVTNAAKHGTGANGTAEVRVELFDRDDELVLVVSDSGPGFSDGFAPGVGSEVVDQLVSQNQGVMTRASDCGARVEIVFPLATVYRESPVRVGATA